MSSRRNLRKELSILRTNVWILQDVVENSIDQHLIRSTHFSGKA